MVAAARTFDGDGGDGGGGALDVDRIRFAHATEKGRRAQQEAELHTAVEFRLQGGGVGGAGGGEA